MAISYRFDDDLLEIVVEGDHEVADFFTVVNRAVEDPEWSGSAWLLIDVRQSRAVTRRTAQEIRSVVDFLSDPPGRFRNCTALLVSSTMQQEVSRVGAAMADFRGSEVKAFYDRTQAVSWLRGNPRALPPRTLEPASVVVGRSGT
jgi:hypothetical protein